MKGKLYLAILLLLFGVHLHPVAHAGPIYVYKEADGSVRFTTRTPPAHVKAETFTARNGSYARYSVSKKYKPRLYSSSKYDSIIRTEASKRGLDHRLVKAVIHAESAFNPHARSPKGAMGLMQLMPGTASLMGVRNAYEPSQNIRGGVAYLSMLFKRYDGNLQYALAAYNAGPQAVDSHGGIPPYKETKHYVQRVIRLFKEYSVHG